MGATSMNFTGGGVLYGRGNLCNALGGAAAALRPI